MSKRLLIDFSDDIAVVFFGVEGRQYTTAFNNKHDLWEFLQKAPKAINASVASANARRAAQAIATERKLSLDEASRTLANMPQSQVTFMVNLGQANARPAIKFNPEELDF